MPKLTFYPPLTYFVAPIRAANLWVIKVTRCLPTVAFMYVRIAHDWVLESAIFAPPAHMVDIPPTDIHSLSFICLFSIIFEAPFLYPDFLPQCLSAFIDFFRSYIDQLGVSSIGYIPR